MIPENAEFKTAKKEQVFGTVGQTPAAHIPVAGFDSWLCFQSSFHGRQQVMSQVSGSLSPTWDTQTEFWTAGSSPAQPSPGCCRHLGREPEGRWRPLSLSFSLPPFLPPSAFQVKQKNTSTITIMGTKYIFPTLI